MINFRTLKDYLSQNTISKLIEVESSVFNSYGEVYDANPWKLLNFQFVLPGKQELSFVVCHNEQPIGFSIAYLFYFYYRKV